MNIKSLLLGSAAALAVVSGAQAADAVVAAEPEPMEYVRVCDAYGTGFFYIPGTETCLKIGGHLRFEKNYEKAKGSAAAYEWHNYGKTTIGNRSDIERVPIDNLQAFYRKYYQPDNIVLIITGRFHVDKALQLVEKYLGSIPKPDRVLQPTYTIEPPQDGERLVELRRVGQIGSLIAVYHMPAAAHPDRDRPTLDRPEVRKSVRAAPHHPRQSLAGVGPGDDVISQHRLQLRPVATLEQRLHRAVRQRGEGLVRGREHGEGARSGERLDEAGGLHGGDERREVVGL